MSLRLPRPWFACRATAAASAPGSERTMTNPTFIQLAQLCTILIGLLSIAVSLRTHRRQMHAQLFLEFSSRLHDVLGSMPAEAWMTADAHQALPPASGELTRSSLQCFQVIAALYSLRKGGYVSGELWATWQRGIKRTMQGPVLRREWAGAQDVFSHNVEFCRYMRRLVHGDAAASPKSAATRLRKDR